MPKLSAVPREEMELRELQTRSQPLAGMLKSSSSRPLLTRRRIPSPSGLAPGRALISKQIWAWPAGIGIRCECSENSALVPSRLSLTTPAQSTDVLAVRPRGRMSAGCWRGDAPLRDDHSLRLSALSKSWIVLGLATTASQTRPGAEEVLCRLSGAPPVTPTVTLSVLLVPKSASRQSSMQMRSEPPGLSCDRELTSTHIWSPAFPAVPGQVANSCGAARLLSCA